ncbi:hypothetical protein AVEN_192969-1 [Araneus ventricosus]|uniref:Uncharacterized protein n=1 Tax=Araneus ventricosus TaxID=182803 RepID=A0A4Y2S3E8_ARAVE|nr:hypothetical protein AVEN_192969-1 [Araneus ventricosus]
MHSSPFPLLFRSPGTHYLPYTQGCTWGFLLLTLQKSHLYSSQLEILILVPVVAGIDNTWHRSLTQEPSLEFWLDGYVLNGEKNEVAFLLKMMLLKIEESPISKKVLVEHFNVPESRGEGRVLKLKTFFASHGWVENSKVGMDWQLSGESANTVWNCRTMETQLREIGDIAAEINGGEEDEEEDNDDEGDAAKFLPTRTVAVEALETLSDYFQFSSGSEGPFTRLDELENTLFENSRKQFSIANYFAL